MENKEIDLITAEDAYQIMIEKINYVNQFMSKHFYDSEQYYEYEILNKSIVFYKGRQRNPRTRSMYAKASFDDVFKYFYNVLKFELNNDDEFKTSYSTTNDKLCVDFSFYLIIYGDENKKKPDVVEDFVPIYRDEDKDLYLEYKEKIKKIDLEKKEKTRKVEEEKSKKEKETHEAEKQARKEVRDLKKLGNKLKLQEKKEAREAEKKAQQEKIDNEELEKAAQKEEFELLENEIITKNDSVVYDSVSLERKIYLSTEFNSQMQRLSRTKTGKTFYEPLCTVLNKLATLNKEDLKKYLYMSVEKKFKSVDRNLYKLYVNGNSGNRLIYIYGNDLKNDKYKNSIIILTFVKDHDRQNREAQKNDKPIDTNSLEEYVLDIESSNHSEKIFKYVKSPTFKYRFILSDEQEKMVQLSMPALIKGNAGAGKTVISFELYERLRKQGYDAYYITFNNHLVNYAKDYLKDESIDNKHLVTTSNFMMNMLSKKPDNYIDFTSFKDWLHNDKTVKKMRITDVSTYVLWTFIRGVIKGHYMDSYEYYSKEEFFKYIHNNEPKYEGVKEKIYECYNLYQKYLKKNDLFDDNDLASIIISKKIRENYYFIVDEVQDLTKRVLYALIHMTEGNQIFMFGDPNQTIQPTIIDINSIQSYFIDTIAYNNYKKEKLPTTYRNGKSILKFINYLNQLRIDLIGKSDTEDDTVIVSNRDDGEDLCAIKSIGNKDLNKRVLELALNNPNTYILVSSDEEKDKLKSINPDFDTRVSTIEDVKGLEHDNIIIYNFGQDNKKYIKDILLGNGKKDTFSRTLFNRLYVASTRARNRIVILEDNKDIIYDEFYKGIIENNLFEEIELYITSKETNPEMWLNAAENYKKEHFYASAEYAYTKLKKILNTTDYDEDITLCEALESVNNKVNNRSIPPQRRYEILAQNVDIFIENMEYDFIYDALERLHQNGVEYTDLYYYIKLLKGISWTESDLDNIAKLTSLKFLSRDIAFINKHFISDGVKSLNDKTKEIEKIIGEIV